MTTTAQMRGHPVYWDGLVWRYQDDGTLAPASGGEERPCAKCGLTAEGDYGPDPCLGWIEGSTGACCGHGVARPDVLTAARNNFAARLDRAWGGEKAAQALQMLDWAIDEEDRATRLRNQSRGTQHDPE